VPRFPGAADVVTITMGGNDLMGAYGDARVARRAIDAVARTGDDILRRVRVAAGAAAAVVLTTVYDPSDGTGAVPGGVLPPWPEGLLWWQS
jgi:lysophospholipase L1-like esterase